MKVEKEIVNKGATKFKSDFSEEIYSQTYRFDNEDINDTHHRVAVDLAKLEKNKNEVATDFVKLLEDFKFSPGGRITSNAGTGLGGTTYINCFVDGFMGEDQDSMGSIMDTLKRQSLILKSEGGYGFCADIMRPRGSFIHGIGNESPGTVKMLDMWDKQSEVITAGSGKKSKVKGAKEKIRKGAQMVTLSVWHPGIEEFITAKQTPGRLTKFNMSILADEVFMEAVKSNSPWNLEFPDTTALNYSKEWDGNLYKWKAEGNPTVVYHTYDNANVLWDVIMESTYNRNEPGILFISTINRLNNLWYCEHINATNPCGEQVLPVGGVCLLGSWNLTQFIKDDMTGWDLDKLKRHVPSAVRFMDNVNDITYVPLESQRENLKNKRRIGMGIMGLGSALMMMRVKYGGKKSLALIEELMTFLSNETYKASALLAKEKGAFPAYDEDKYLKGEFIKNLQPETISLIKKHGLRNSHLLSVQPTGTTAIVSNNVSGGLEPVFLAEYVRTSIQPFPPDGLKMPKNVDFDNQKAEFEDGGVWTWIKEGDESLLKTKFRDAVYKFDRNRGLVKDTRIKDYAVEYLEERGKWNPKANWASTTEALSIDAHTDVMKIISKHIDSAMSKTVNIPNDYPYEDFKKLYMNFYESGTIKGGTTYRAGTMTTVLASVEEEKNTGRGNKIQHTEAPKRPKELHCDIYQPTVGGVKWIVLMGLLNGEPYEIFAFKKHNLQIPERYKDGMLIKRKKNHYDLMLEEDFILEDMKSHFNRSEEEALTRLISTGLRHGAAIEYIYEQLQKSEGTIVSFSKAVARTLKRYIKDETKLSTKCDNCGAPDGLVFQEGCMVCKSCGDSKCA